MLADLCQWLIRNILVILAFHCVILTCALASVFEVLRFISLLIIQLIWDETTSKSLHWYFFLFFFQYFNLPTSKTENFWVLFCFSFSGMTGLNITEKDKIAQFFKVDEKWGGKLNAVESENDSFVAVYNFVSELCHIYTDD